MENISDIINNYITENRISKAALSREMNISANALSERLKVRDLKTSFVLRLSKVMNHNFFDYLGTKTDESFKVQALEREVEMLKREKELLMEIIIKKQ